MKAPLTLAVAVGVWLVPSAGTGPAWDGERRAAVDSAREELRVGRAWHASRILRGALGGAAEPQETLLLARAEAGWGHHAEVVRLLDGAAWLDDVEGGEGWVLLGRAFEARERWDRAAEAYGHALSLRSGEGASPATALRRARSLLRGGALDDGVAALEQLREAAEPAASWLAAEEAARAAEAGDTAAVTRLLVRVRDEGAREAAWRTAAAARLEAGDTVGAVEALLDESGRSEARGEAGLLLLARGDTVAARPHLRVGLEAKDRALRGRVAESLAGMAGDDRAELVRLAAILNRAGVGAAALRAYDRAYRLAKASGAELDLRARLARARLMGTVRSRQGAAIEEMRALAEATRDSADLGPAVLSAWIRIRRSQGRERHVAVLRRWMEERFPGSAATAAIRWDRAWSAETRGDAERALREYARLVEDGGSLSRAGQARMRMGQIHLSRGDVARARIVFEDYLASFPKGRRWEEAAFWSARSALQEGDTAHAVRRVQLILRESPLSYYAVMGSDLLGRPYRLDVPEGPPVTRPAWLSEGLRRLDLLEAAGLERGAEAEVATLAAKGLGDPAAALTLADALVERGHTIDAINLAWALREDGAEWTRRLLRAAYPFPYRELVVREARERGADPIVLAALIRQESAFEAGIVSHAGAIGLMQVMPPTGRQLARSHGPSRFTPTALKTPEINLHLGSAFFVEMRDRYDGALPLVLSAYNAGPTRARRWRRYPEVRDPLRFTERIPFAETRGYVKAVRRNIALYRALYGDA